MPFDSLPQEPQITTKSVFSPLHTERLLELEALLRSDRARDHFYMAYHFLDGGKDTGTEFPRDMRDCGTTACIAGWAAIHFGLKAANIYEVREHLGISFDMAHALMLSPGANGAISCRDPLIAADVIHHLIETGAVNWSLAMEKASA